MKLNIIANHLRTQQGEPLTVEMLEAELAEVISLRPKTTVGKMDKNRHIASLKAMINHKQKQQQCVK